MMNDTLDNRVNYRLCRLRARYDRQVLRVRSGSYKRLKTDPVPREAFFSRVILPDGKRYADYGEPEYRVVERLSIFYENEYLVTFNCPEFTTLCPKTGQPDFGHIYISYIPRERMVESKSLKLYLFSFRNHGDFHEDCVNIIMKDLVKLMDPKYLEVTGYFMPRGGISIYPFANYADKEHEALKAQRLHDQLIGVSAKHVK